MSGLMTFNNPEFGTIRTVELEGEPWFVGKDVAVALGYKDTVNALKTRVCHEDKRGGWQITTPSGQQGVTIINESGLYSLILSSKLPGAKQFKRWVTAEVLPSIRKQGGYLTAAAQEAVEKLAATVNALTERVERLESRPALPALRQSGELGYRAWAKKVRDKILLLGMTEGLDDHEILPPAYRTMERELGVDLEAERQDTMARYGLDDCSTLRSIYYRDDLRAYFQTVIDREFRYEELKGW